VLGLAFRPPLSGVQSEDAIYLPIFPIASPRRIRQETFCRVLRLSRDVPLHYVEATLLRLQKLAH
jgi:hypothetical protein